MSACAAPFLLQMGINSAGVSRLEPAQSVPWDALVRAHDHAVRMSLLALGLRPDRAREIAQAAWLRLFERHAAGDLATVELPGLAIRQARFLALDELRRDAAERRRTEKLDPDDATAADALERQLASREILDRVAAVVATCAPGARRLFELHYGRNLSHADAAAALGLSVQRARQLLCETRAVIRAALAEEDV
jgi:RNA polymerase sigma-70 factor (ECF subfamily)